VRPRWRPFNSFNAPLKCCLTTGAWQIETSTRRTLGKRGAFVRVSEWSKRRLTTSASFPPLGEGWRQACGGEDLRSCIKPYSELEKYGQTLYPRARTWLATLATLKNKGSEPYGQRRIPFMSVWMLYALFLTDQPSGSYADCFRTRPLVLLAVPFSEYVPLRPYCDLVILHRRVKPFSLVFLVDTRRTYPSTTFLYMEPTILQLVWAPLTSPLEFEHWIYGISTEQVSRQ